MTAGNKYGASELCVETKRSLDYPRDDKLDADAPSLLFHQQH